MAIFRPNSAATHTLKITILGSGASLGVPVIACDCATCSSDDLKNKRTRSSVLISSTSAPQKNILVDCGFDTRMQLIKAKVASLEAVIITHEHADHMSGIDELRVFSHIQKRPLTTYMDALTKSKIQNASSYLFDNKILQAEDLKYGSSIPFAGTEIKLFKQDHVRMDSLGIRIKDFVYANDVAFFYPEYASYLQDIDTFVVDCCDYKSTAHHAGLDRVLGWVEEFKPKMTYLTDLSHNLEYHELKRILPQNVQPAYDGLEIYI